MVDEKKITVINTHLLQPNLSNHQITQRVKECVSLSAPGPHVIILILQYKDFRENDRQRVKYVLNLFSEQAMKHTIVLTTDDERHRLTFTSRNNAVHDLIKECGGRHLQFATGNTGWRSELFRRTEEILKKEHEEFLIGNMYEDEGNGSLVHEDMNRSGGSVRDDNKEEDSDLKESAKTGRDGGETLLKAPMKKLWNSFHTLFRSQDSREREDELRIVLLGKTGVGKSSTGNTILEREVFISDISEKSVTKVCQKKTAEINGRHITVIDTPGLFDTDLTNEEIQREISNCIPMILPGPHVFIIVINLGQRFTQEEKTSVKIIQETFGENSLKYTMVLFTRGDDLNNKTIEKYLGNPGSALNQLIDECGNRFHVFNNKETGNRTQVTDLLQKIDNMVKANGGSYYSCKMFRELEREKQEKQKKILKEEVEQVIREREKLMNKHKEEKERMKMMIKEERQNHDKERKKLEGEFREREEQYKRDIKEREEQERKIREELKREREEWENQKQQERQRREEEEEKWRKKELEMWDEYNQRLKQEEERMKVMMDEEKQTHENEKKQREEEFNEREERYKTDIQRERDERERLKQEARQRRGEEEEKRRRTEQETWDDYYKKLKQEKGRMKIMMEEERQNRDKERKRKEEEYLKGEKQYKSDIKDLEEQERKMREELKREREEWKKQKQQEKQREEEDKERHRFTGLYMGTPDLQHTNNDEVSPSDSGCLRILLFGRTGSGKSATGNTILRKKVFRSEESSQSVTTVCQKGVGEVNGKTVAVIDTPGLFDVTSTKEKVQEQIMNCISLSAPGPHAIIIVINMGKIIKEEKDTLDMIKMMFGPKAADFCIVLFTKGDGLRRQTIKQHVERRDDLKKLTGVCGNRFLSFNNTETEDQTQVTQLFNMIKEIFDQGRYFTNELFEEAAISIEQRRQMIEKKETQNLAQVEELEAEYDMEAESMRDRLEKKKQKIDEEKQRLKNKFKEQEMRLWREFEDKEKSEQEKQKTEDRKQSKEEKKQRAEYDQGIEEVKREIEDQRIQNEKQQKEREEEDRKREEKYKEDEEKMKNDHEHIIAELRKEQEEEIKNSDSEEQMRMEQEEKEREKWKRKIREAENDKKEGIKRQQREWEKEKNRQMRKREKEKTERRDKHEKQLREKQEELENKRKTFETKRDEEEQMIEKKINKLRTEREQQKTEHEENINDMKRRYEQLERERKEEWKRRKRDDEERRVEKRKKWKTMMEDLKREQDEEIKRREREERERIDREEKECEEIKQKHEEEIEKMKKKLQDEARKQKEELNDFSKRKEQHIQELKERLEQLYEMKRLREELFRCHVM